MNHQVRCVRRRRRDGGVTLIEILLALIIMVLGLVGILALFPPALQASKEAQEDTQAGITANSVANAMANAVRFATFNAGTGEWTVTFTHDLDNSGSTVFYTYVLPKIADNWKHHPGNVTPTLGKPQNDATFMLTGDPWIKSAVLSTKGYDPTDPLEQFSFSFDVRKINTLAYLIGQPKPGGGTYGVGDLEPIVKMYEFRIHVFRHASNATGGGGTGTGGGSSSKRLVATVNTRITAP